MNKTMKHILLTGLVLLATATQAADAPSYNFYSTSVMSGHSGANGRISHVQVATPAPAADYQRARGTAKGQVFSASAFSEPKLQGGGGFINFSSSVASYGSTRGSRASELNSNVSMTTIKLPALTLHSKNVAAQEAALAAPGNETTSGPRRASSDPIDPDEENDVLFPIGDAVLPMLLFALAFSGVIALRRRRAGEIR